MTIGGLANQILLLASAVDIAESSLKIQKMSGISPDWAVWQPLDLDKTYAETANTPKPEAIAVNLQNLALARVPVKLDHFRTASSGNFIIFGRCRL